MKAISEQGDRVRQNTAAEVQAQLDERVARIVHLYAGQPRELIDRRLEDLDREWDIERVLETNASALAFTGVILGATRGKRWLLLSATVLGFLFQHAVQGWCPPVPVLRRFGVRTQREIERERYALKILRGDFNDLPLEEGGAINPAAALNAIDT